MPPKVSDEHKESIREKIILAAQKIFSKKGFNETTMDDIVEESKFSKGTLYNYYETKEELYCAIIKKSLEGLKQGFERRILQSTSFKAKLEDIMKFYYILQSLKPIDFPKADIESWAVSLKSDFLRNAAKEVFQFHFEFLKKIIQKGTQAGEFKPNLDIQLYITRFMTHIYGGFVIQAFEDKALDWIKLGDLIIPSFLNEILK